MPSALSNLLSTPALARESCLAGKLWQVGGERKAVRQKQLPAGGEEEQGPNRYGQKARRRFWQRPLPNVWVLDSFPSPSQPGLLFQEQALLTGLNSGLKYISEVIWSNSPSNLELESSSQHFLLWSA